MSVLAAIWAVARRAFRWLPMLLGFAVILAAVAIGAFRLLAARLPTYKGDVQAWVRSELGLLVEYEALDMRMTLTGPELQFYGAALAASDDPEQPFVLARVADIRLDGLDLLLNRRFTPTELAFEGIEIAIERTAEGELRIEGIPSSGPLAVSFDFEIPRAVRLVVRDSRITYEDEGRGIRWPFDDVSITVEQSAQAVEMNVTAVPPEALASRAELSIEGDLGQGQASASGWRGFVTVRDADLAALTAVLPELRVAGGHGDVSLWVESEAGQLTSVLSDMALEDVSIDGSEAGLYDRIALTSEWTRMRSQWTLALNDVVLSRAGREWPRRGNTVIEWSIGDGPLSIRTDYLKLEDLTPIIMRLPPSGLRERWAATQPRGELRDFALDAEYGSEEVFELSGDFVDFGLAGGDESPGFDGLTGSVRADARGGSIRLDSTRTVISAAALFGRHLVVDNLAGLILWRRGRTADRLVTDDLAFDVLGAHVSTSLELGVPHDGGSPRLDLESQIGAFDIAAIKPYIVAAQPREVVARWLDSALSVGRVDSATATFFGPLDAFPFAAGEGQFRAVAEVRDGVLDYVDGWPRAEDFEGQVEFLNEGFTARGHARVLGNVSENVEVTIDDLVSDPVLHVTADTTGPLDDLLRFLLEAPSIARFLGPGYSQLSAPAGVANVRLDLRLPLPPEDYDLEAGLDIVDGTLAFAGFGPQASDINGFLELRDGAVTGQDIAATFLDGPVTAQVAVPEREGYRSEIIFEGEVSAESALAAFDLPYRDRLAGQTRWRGRLSLPDVAAEGAEFAHPALVEADANLSGVALRFPEPFAKAPREVTNLHVAFSFGAGDSLNVSGNLGATRHFDGEFVKRDVGLAFSRGRLSFGEQGDRALPAAGLEISGSLPRLDLDAWRTLVGAGKVTPGTGALGRVDLAIGDLTAYGQSLGATHVAATLDAEAAALAIESEPVAGRVTLPLGRSRGTIAADLERLHLQTGRESEALATLDPVRLPGLDVAIGDFRVGPRRLGQFGARIAPDPLGLRLTSLTSQSDAFHAEGSGAWLRDASGNSESRLALSMTSTDVAAALEALGFDPIIAGEGAELTASLHWPGGPSADWMSHVGGDIAVRVGKGSMLDIEPGAGRIVGLMSIAALPRRLALDFRDVFNRGFVFDEITADFRLIDGNAYTDNLKLTGPAAEIGVVGRTGLRDRDFRQQAVVTAEPGNMLPTVGGLIAGPGVGAALLIFTRIFKKPLKGLGRVSYCIEGSWDAPTVERLENEELCAELPPEWAREALVEGAQ